MVASARTCQAARAHPGGAAISATTTSVGTTGGTEWRSPGVSLAEALPGAVKVSSAARPRVIERLEPQDLSHLGVHPTHRDPTRADYPGVRGLPSRPDEVEAGGGRQREDVPGSPPPMQGPSYPGCAGLTAARQRRG